MTTIIRETQRTVPTVGIHHNIPFNEYCNWDAINWHTLAPFRVSAKNGHYEMTHATLSTDSEELGDSFHAMIGEPERFEAQYAVMPDFPGHHNSKAYKEAVANWEAEHYTQARIDASEMHELRMMKQAVEEHPIASKILAAPGKCEFAIVWNDKVTGALCKGKVDKLCRLASGVISLAAPKPELLTLAMVDWKTTRAKTLRDFNKQRADLAYHGQLAFYIDGLATLAPAEIVPLLVAVQNAPPFDVWVCDMRELMETGRKLYRGLLQKLLDGRKAKRWPGVAEAVVPLFPHPWEVDQFDKTNEEE